MTLYIMDTDHLSLFERGSSVLRDRMLAVRKGAIYHLAVTAISVEEQFSGRLAQIRKANTSRNLISAYGYLKATFMLFSDLEILDYDARADERFHEFRKAGIRIGTQDLRIAAISIVNAGVLVTRNRRDFERVPGLSMQDWSI
jgi:tRNA(fMet)-specific endonuclease VapC